MTVVAQPAVERSRLIPGSPLHDVHRVVQAHPGALALHVGEPYIQMPDSARRAFVRAIRDGRTQYTDAPGLPALREAIAERLADNGAPSPDRVFITPGSCQAIAAALHSIAFDGAVALLPEIHWPTHVQQVALAGMTPRFVAIDDDPVAALDAAWDQAVCVLVLNSPANPSGRVLDRRTIAAVHEWAVRRRVWIVSDEAYEDFVYEGEAPRTAAFDAAVPFAERVVFSMHTFSKNFSMTGCRLGYATAPNAERAALLQRVQEATLIAPSTPVQYAGLAALNDVDHVVRHRHYVGTTRNAVMDVLEETGLVFAAPAGGWYLLLDVAPLADDAAAWCDDLLRRTNVAVAPGAGFVPPGHPMARRLVRVALCGEREATLEAVERIAGESR